MTSKGKDPKPVEVNSIISVVKHENNNSHSKMELKSVVRVAHNGGKKLKAHEPKNTKTSKSSNEKPILLQPFGHQVSGRASILCYDETTLLKPYVSRELFFYQTVPHDLKKFTPQFRGLITVSFIEDSRSSEMLAYALPLTMIKPHAKSMMKMFTEDPKPHSKRCVKDFGKTHVIYPKTAIQCNPSEGEKDLFVVTADYDQTMGQCLSNNEDDDDIVSELSQGFEMTVSINDRKPPFTDAEMKPRTGLHNPWNSKVLDDAWLKLKCNEADAPSSGRKKRFALLENVVARYRRPCVLDLKIGTRVRENASPEKIARHVTAINLGARLSGMQIYHPVREQFTYHNKYYGHNLTVAGFRSNLLHFFSRGSIPIKGLPSKADETSTSPPEETCPIIDRRLVRHAIRKLKRLRDAVAKIQSHRFYSSSVLLLYEGDDVTKNNALDCDSVTESSEDERNSRNSLEAHHRSRSHFENGMTTRSFSFSEFLHHLRSSQHKHRGRQHPRDRLEGRDTHECSRHHEKRVAHEKHSKESRSRLHEIHRANGKKYQDPGSEFNSLPSTQFQNKSWPRSKQDQLEERRPSRSEFGKSLSRRKVSKSPSREENAERCGEREESLIDVRMIDFAHYCFNDSEMHPGPDGGFLFGLDNVMKLLKEMLKS